MEHKADWESLNFEGELGDLQEAARNLQIASTGFGPGLRAYIKALKTLNAEMLGRLRRLGEAREAGAKRNGLRERRRCQRTAAARGAVRTSGYLGNNLKEVRRRRAAAVSASPP
jgi:hypothetical protein